MNRFFALFLCLTCVLSCGYHMGQGELSSHYQSISVPYVEGDSDGSLTAAIIKQIAICGVFDYCTEGGDLTLIAKVAELRDENIGFRYDVNKKGKIIDSVIPVETRIKAIVEITIVESASGGVIRGPVKLATSEDFDHDYYQSHDAVNVFSLGQLSDYDSARDAVSQPLNETIARMVKDFIINSW